MAESTPENTGHYPLDPELFNPDVVGHQFAILPDADQDPLNGSSQGLDGWSPPALGPRSDDGFVPSEDFCRGEDDWALGLDDPNDVTEEEFVDDDDEEEETDAEDETEDEDDLTGLRELPKQRKKRACKSRKRDSGSGSSIRSDSSDEDEGPDETDLTRLIQAIHSTNTTNKDETRGLLSQEWDRSMDQELTELQEAEKSLRFGRRKRHKIRGEPELSAEVSMLLGKANICFIEKKYDEAIPLFEEIVRIEPMCKMAWNNLGAIYQDLMDFEKACQFRMIGAHLTAKSEHLWKELGAESRQYGLLSQAIYCYSEAIKAAKDDVEAMWDRSYLLYEVGRPRQALLGYLGILKLNPYNPDVLREIAHLCATTDERELPLKLFKDAFEHYRMTFPVPSHEELQVGFGKDHLIILIGLSMTFSPDTLNLTIPQENPSLSDEERLHAHYSDTIGIIKQATRWLQGRADPQSPSPLDWDLLDDDREFDICRRQRDEWEILADQRYEEQPVYPMEPYFRTCLGICRLKIGDDEEAKLHFDIIKEQSIAEHSDLFGLIGDAYFESQMWHEALEFFQELADNEPTNTPSVWHKIGQCYRKSGNLEEASECFEAIVETDYMDLVAKTQLAEIYELTGKQDEAYAMVDDIIEVRRKARSQGIVIEKDPLAGAARASCGNQSRTNNPLATRNTTTSKSIKERRMEEIIRTERYVNSYKRLEELASQLAKVNVDTSQILMNELVRIANPMIEGFRQTQALFPFQLGKKFAGVNAPSKRSKKDEASDDKVAEESLRPETGTEFRGISFPDWVRIFVYYAFCCSKIQKNDEASEVLGHVMNAPVFRQSAAMQQVLRLAYAAICYAKGDFVGVTDTIRWLGLRLLYHNDPVRLISALLSQGFQQSMAFTNANLQKWFLRQIKLIDEHAARAQALREGELDNRGDDNDVTRTVSRPQLRGRGIRIPRLGDEDQRVDFYLEDDDEDESYWKPTKFIPKKANPVFVLSFASILAATRSFQSAIVHYLRIYERHPHEPLLNMVLGISYSQRAMQRQTDNRHHQIVQATAFFNRYKKLRSSKFAEEVEYNLGRFYHGLGLSTLAITHYERVLSISSNQIDGRDEEMINFPALAAYNLVLIYQMSGSPDLAHGLISEYLVRWVSDLKKSSRLSLDTDPYTKGVRNKGVVDDLERVGKPPAPPPQKIRPTCARACLYFFCIPQYPISARTSGTQQSKGKPLHGTSVAQ